MSFQTHTHGELTYLTAPVLGAIRHGFSTRKGGVSCAPFDSLNLGINRGDDPSAVLENYSRFCASIGIDPANTVLSNQVHKTNVKVCTGDDRGKGLFYPRNYEADALITNVPDVALTVFSADCGILLLYDPCCHAIGAIHAGWRGCASGIVEKTVRAMQRNYGTDPKNLTAAVGPCIGPCCFETDQDVPDAMSAALKTDAAPFLRAGNSKKWNVDLAGLNKQWLLRAGVPESQIELYGICTACHPELFWSHRKMGEARGLQVAMIAL